MRKTKLYICSEAKRCNHKGGGLIRCRPHKKDSYGCNSLFDCPYQSEFINLKCVPVGNKK